MQQAVQEQHIISSSATAASAGACKQVLGSANPNTNSCSSCCGCTRCQVQLLQQAPYSSSSKGCCCKQVHSNSRNSRSSKQVLRSRSSSIGSKASRKECGLAASKRSTAGAAKGVDLKCQMGCKLETYVAVHEAATAYADRFLWSFDGAVAWRTCDNQVSLPRIGAQ